jgi:hypothetical protein
MKLSKSRHHYHKDGVRISKALYEEILQHAVERGEVSSESNQPGSASRWRWVHGMTANVYCVETQAGKVDWAEQLLKAGEIDG